MTYRLGVDVGGTFTDLLLIDEDTGATHRAKSPSTPADQSVGVLVGIEKVCALAGIEPSAIDHVMHGTTVATNAVLEGKGATVGLVMTAGLQPGAPGRPLVRARRSRGLDHLAQARTACGAGEHGRGRRAGRRPRRGRHARSTRRTCARKLKYLRAQGVDAVTVAPHQLLREHRHEQRIGELVAEEIPGVPISLSSVILPEIREYERTLTTVANSYVRPTVGRYLTNLEARAARQGDQRLAARAALGRRPRRRRGGDRRAGPAADVRARGRRLRRLLGRPAVPVHEPADASTWAARRPTSRSSRTGSPGSAARPRSARSTCGRRPSTSAPSAPAAARSRTSPS